LSDAVSLLSGRFHASAGKVLLVCEDGAEFTYAQVWANARRIAEIWKTDGVEPGDTVALVLRNDPAVLSCYLACFIGGFVAAPINPELGDTDVEFIRAMVRPALTVWDPPALDGAAGSATDWTMRLDPAAVGAIFFTSGTTGRPKGVRHGLNALIGNVMSFNGLMGLGEGTRLYHVMPMTYMAGFLNTMLSPIMAGGTILLGPRFSPQSALDFWSRPGETRANALWISPSMAAALTRTSRDAEAARRGAAGFAAIFCGTAPLHTGVRQSFRQTFGVPLQESYGTSELLLIAAQRRADADTTVDVGPLLRELAVRTRDNAEGQPELMVRSPFHYLGYITEAGTVPPDLDEGFMPTGDMGALVDGRLRITGRIKDLIIRGGVNIAPVTLENALAGLSGLEDVAVVSVPHEFWGEAIVVCVQPAPGTEATALEQAVRARCRERLARSHQPDRIVVIENFPRAVTGKVQKHQLRTMFAA
jgi:long-chain acyl-CoA synthetase